MLRSCAIRVSLVSVLFLIVAAAQLQAAAFAPPVAHVWTQSPGAIVTGDFNGDGRPDIAVLSPSTGVLAIVLNDRDGVFSAAGTYDVGVGSVHLISADFNGDGHLDLAIANYLSGTVMVLLGNGDGSFQPAVRYAAGAGANWVAVGDVNGDGKPDLAVANALADSVTILLGNGDGSFTAAPTIALAKGSFPTAMAAGDFSRDGKLDLAVANARENSITILNGRGDGSFSKTRSLAVNCKTPASIAAAEFNGNGVIDLAVVGRNSNMVCVLPGNGDGGFGAEKDYRTELGNYSIVAADLNGDGLADVVVTNFASHTVSLLAGNDNGSLQPVRTLEAGAGPSFVAAADMDGDGRPDLVVVDALSNTVSVLMNTLERTSLQLTVSGATGRSRLQAQVTAETTMPRGIVVFRDGWQKIGQARIDSGGQATFAAGRLGAGVHPFAATYVPYSDHFGSTAAALTNAGGAAPVTAAAAISTASTAPAVALTPASLAFGGQGVGTTSSPAQKIILKNTGTQTLSISNVAITGTNAGDFTIVSNGCAPYPKSVAGGATCSLTVNFHPTLEGPETANVTFSDTAANSPQNLVLSGNGVTGPFVTLTPASVTFVKQVVGVSAVQTVQVKNTGNASLLISSIVLAGTNVAEFSKTTTCKLNTSLAVGSVCNISLTLLPTSSGAKSATLTINDNVTDAAGPSPQVVNISGSAVDAPYIVLTPNSAKFPSQGVGITTNPPVIITLKNAGDLSLTISGMSITGTSAANFQATPASCSPLAAGASCTISISFVPSATSTRSATLNINSNAFNSALKVPLSGTGITGPFAVLSATKIPFGSQGINQNSAVHTLTLYNTGGQTLTSSMVLGGTNPSVFSAVPNNCASIAAGASCTIAVTFSPVATGTFSATLTFSDNANTLSAVTLTGTGANGPVATLSATSINFGSEQTGVKSPSVPITLTNTGNAALLFAAANPLAFTGTNFADYSETDNCPKNPAALAIGANCVINVSFTPASVGTRTASLVISDNAVVRPQKVALSGLGISQNSTPTITVTLTQSSTLTFSSLTTGGTVQINTVAPAGGQQVFLSSNNTPVATVPSSVTIPAGQQSATFSISTASASGTAVITGFANSFQSGTANLTVNARQMALLPASSVVGVGRNVSASLTLHDPAPPLPSGCTTNCGVTINLASTDPTIATISPPSVFIAAGSTTSATAIQIAGASTGTTSLTAQASGYSNGTANQTVTNQLITIAKNITVAPGQSLPIPISLSQAAPAGGTTVRLSSSNTSVLTVTSSVSIPAGATAPVTQPQITGVAIGSATVTASDQANLFAPDSGTENVSLALTFSPTSLTVLTYNTANIILNLSAPAPSGGFTANLSIDDTTKATVPATVTFAAGASSATVTVTGVAVGNTNLHATATGAQPASAAITVNPAPAITLNGTTVGKDVEAATGGSLAAPAPAGNLNITITSSDPTKVLLAANATTAGTSSIVVQAGAGSSVVPSFYVQGLTSSGSATITATATGYAPGPATITLDPTGFIFTTSSFSTAPGAPDVPLTVVPVLLDPNTLAPLSSAMQIRGGASPSVPVTSSATAVGTVTTSPVGFTGGMSSGTTAFHALTTGSSNVSLTEPAGFAQPSSATQIVATVSSQAVSLVSATTLGQNLQTATSVSLSAPAPAGNLQVTVSSSDATKLALSTDPTVAGTGSITLTVPAGGIQSPNFYMQALAGSGSVTVQAQAPGFGTGTGTVSMVPSGFVLLTNCGQSSLATTYPSSNSNLDVVVVPLDPNTLQPNLVDWNGGCGFTGIQTLNPGVGPISIDVNDAVPAVGTITTSPVVFNTNDAFQNTAFQAAAVGTDTLSIAAPVNFATPNSDQQITVSVTAAGLYVSVPPVGKDLQRQVNVSLASAAPPGNEQVTLTSSDPSKLLLSTDPTVAGSASIGVVVFAGNGTPSLPVYAQALDSSGPVTITASAPDFGTGSVSAQLAPAGFVLSSNCVGQDVTTTTTSADTTLTVSAVALDPVTLNDVDLPYGCYPNPLPLRPGVTASIAVTSSSPAVGSITTTPLAFNPGDQSQTTAFHPLSVGSSTVSISTPAGFSTPADYQQLSASVSNGTFNLSADNIGKNLETQVALSLTTMAPSGGLTVTLTSGDASKLLLSTDPTVAGSSTVSVSISPDSGASTTPIYAQALVGSGTVTLTASAPGFDSASYTATLVPSGFVIGVPSCIATGSFSTTPLNPDTGLAVYATALDPSTLNDVDVSQGCYQVAEGIRPGIGSVSVDVISGNASAGSITTSPVIFNAGDSSQSTNFHPLSNGTSLITMGTPSMAGFSTPSNYQQVTATVTNGSIYLSAGPIGNNLQQQVTMSLSAAAPSGGDVITFTSADASKLVLSTDPAVLGTGSVSVPVLAGDSTSTTPVYAQALAGTGSVNLSASGTSFDPQTIPVSLAPSGFVMAVNPCLASTSFSTSLLSGTDTPLSVYAVALDPTTLNDVNTNGCVPYAQLVRPGIGPVSVPLTSSNTSVGTTTVNPVVFNTGDASQASAFHPVSNGTSVVALGGASVGGFSTPSNYQQVTANVSPSTIYLSDAFVGIAMQTSTSISLSDPAPSSGLTVTVSVDPTKKVLLSYDPSTLGATSLTFNLPGGSASTPTFYVQVQKGAVQGNVSFTASATGFSNASALVHVMASGFVFQQVGTSFNTTVNATDTSLQIYPAALDSSLNLYAIQTLIPGLMNTQVQVLTSATCGGTLNQSVGDITVSPVVFNGNDSPDFQDTSFHALAVGSTVIYVPAPTGFSQASNNNCVTANVTN